MPRDILLTTTDGKTPGFPLPTGMPDYPDVVVVVSSDDLHQAAFKRDGLNVNGDEVYRQCTALKIRNPFE